MSSGNHQRSTNFWSTYLSLIAAWKLAFATDSSLAMITGTLGGMIPGELVAHWFTLKYEIDLMSRKYQSKGHSTDWSMEICRLRPPVTSAAERPASNAVSSRDSLITRSATSGTSGADWV